MSINLKKKNITLGITKLTSKKTWRAWDNAYTRYVGTLKLKHYLHYDIQEPLKILFDANRENQTQINEIKELAT